MTWRDQSHCRPNYDTCGNGKHFPRHYYLSTFITFCEIYGRGVVNINKYYFKNIKSLKEKGLEFESDV